MGEEINFAHLPYSWWNACRSLLRIYRSLSLFPDLKDGEPLTRTGSEFRHGDQIIDTANPPPRKFIVAWSNWGSYETDLPAYKPPYENLQAQENCLKSLREVSPNFDGDINHAEQFMRTSSALIEAKTRELNEKKENFNNYKEGMSPKDIADNENKIWLDEADLQRRKESLEKFKATLNELMRLKQEESQRIPDYQQQVAEKDAIVRENIWFIDSIWLSVLDKEDIDLMIFIINGYRQSKGDERIDLKKALTGKDKSEIIKGLQTIMKEHGEGLFRTDERGYMSLIEDGNARDRVIGWLRQAGIVGKVTDSDTGVTIEDRMRKGFGEEKEEESEGVE